MAKAVLVYIRLIHNLQTDCLVETVDSIFIASSIGFIDMAFLQLFLFCFWDGKLGYNE